MDNVYSNYNNILKHLYYLKANYGVCRARYIKECKICPLNTMHMCTTTHVNDNVDMYIKKYESILLLKNL